ncbi:hypothetical protein HPB52_024807 [Rhipicephalus sanguineus]|uniref:Uncharacterized protein n=1 Tax=Rhipicephalus sanguineus TaxID=34632 RepID=A0A9D4PAY8_RHISA|nr:hypothetical protein HPB52_024807 [Rhipicephalus sanguineus]
MPTKETTLVAPHVRSDYWQNTAAWDIYKFLKARQTVQTPENRAKSPVTVEVCLADLSTDPAISDEDVAEVSQTLPASTFQVLHRAKASIHQSKLPMCYNWHYAMGEEIQPGPVDEAPLLEAGVAAGL